MGFEPTTCGLTIAAAQPQSYRPMLPVFPGCHRLRVHWIRAVHNREGLTEVFFDQGRKHSKTLPRPVWFIYICGASPCAQVALFRIGAGMPPTNPTAQGYRSLPTVTACVVALCGLVPYVHAYPGRCRRSLPGRPHRRRAFRRVLHVRGGAVMLSPPKEGP